jgi:hypothetical protein
MKPFALILVSWCVVACALDIPLGSSPTPTNVIANATATKPLSNQSVLDDQLGIAFTYPSGWAHVPRVSDTPNGLTLMGPRVGTSAEPFTFAITLNARVVNETTLAAAVDAQLEGFPAEIVNAIKRTKVTACGEPAEQLTGQPALAGSLDTYVLRKGKLFHFSLSPYDSQIPALAPYLSQVRAAYDEVLRTCQFVK